MAELKMLHMWRDSTGAIGMMCRRHATGVVEFWYSTDDGATWREHVELRRTA